MNIRYVDIPIRTNNSKINLELANMKKKDLNIRINWNLGKATK